MHRRFVQVLEQVGRRVQKELVILLAHMRRARPVGVERLQDFGALAIDLADTAALVACMDLVISVDTGVAHVAGAIGKPVWILLPFAPDYRWMLDRDDTPWYPTARLFRQSSPGDWNSVIAEVVQAMQELGASD